MEERRTHKVATPKMPATNNPTWVGLLIQLLRRGVVVCSESIFGHSRTTFRLYPALVHREHSRMSTHLLGYTRPTGFSRGQEGTRILLPLYPGPETSTTTHYPDSLNRDPK